MSSKKKVDNIGKLYDDDDDDDNNDDDDVDGEEEDVSEANILVSETSKLSAGARIFRGP